MHWQVSHKLGQLVMDAAPRFTITYDDLDTYLGGQVDVKDISLVPVGQSEAFKITRISIQGPNAFTYLLNNNPLVDDPGPPEYLNVLIQQLNLDLTGPLATELADLDALQPAVNFPQWCFWQGCRSRAWPAIPVLPNA